MRYKYYIHSVIVGVLMAFAACTPDKYELGEVDITSEDLAEGLAYTITHDEDNPNIIYLKSLLESKYTCLWEHPQGRSEAAEVTLQMPFAGEYEVTFGVQTRGGVVYGETTTFTVDDFCEEFVTDQLWTYISGGVGESKKWYLDIDASGVSRYFSGPVYFYGTDDSWETVTNGTSLDTDVYDSWSWAADYSSVAGWQFTTELIDFGYMEFDLIGNSNLTVVNNAFGTTETGVYMLDTDNHTITLTDVKLLHDEYNDGAVSSWSGTLKLLSLTEDAMQIGVERISDPALLSFNFISEDYYNNWSPTTTTDEGTIELDDDWRDYVEPKTNKVITYTLAADDTPFDWCSLDGSTKGAGSAFTAVSGIDALTLVLNSNDYTYTVTTPDGTEVTGDYELSDDGVYTFSNGLPEVTLSTNGRAVFKANSDNTLRILQYATDSYSGALSDLWLGSDEIDVFGNTYQYMGYHFVPYTSGDDEDRFEATLTYFNTGWTFYTSSSVYVTGDGTYTLTISGSDSSPYGLYLDVVGILDDYPNCDIAITDIQVDGSSVYFDDDEISRSEGDDSSTARRYIVNPWEESTANDAPYYSFSSSIAVTVQVTMDTGTPFVSE